MAPPTGPRASASAPAGRSRGNSRGGGIQKRRANINTKIDRDGDVAMDAQVGKGTRAGSGAAGAGGRGRGRKSMQSSRGSGRTAQNVANYAAKNLSSDPSQRGGRANAIPSKARFAYTAALKISGLGMASQDRNLASILTFLERKASKDQSKSITINKSATKGDDLFIQISKDDVPNFFHLDGFTYAGAKMNITESHEPWPQKAAQKPLTQEAAETKEKLKGVLFNRYNTATRVLDLSSLGQDPTLVAMNLFGAKSTAEKAFKALVVISDQQFQSAEAKAEAIQGVSLASNELSTVAPVFDLAETFPELKMLDLSGNKIEAIHALTKWRHRFRSLESIVLAGNPVEILEPNHKTQLLQWYPKLQFINGEQVRSIEEVTAKEVACRPIPIPQRGSDFRDVDGIGETFLRSFFPLYDTDRSSLLSTFYDEETVFSLSVVTKSTSVGPTAPWQPYLKYSRNMEIIQTDAARSQRLFEGVALIGDLWKDLPATKHPDLTDLSKYIIDCRPIPALADPNNHVRGGVGGLIITVHGQFDEMDKDTQQTNKRSFSRNIVLSPGKVGRNSIRVVSDMLSLRAFNPVPVFIGGPVIANVEEFRKQMTVELSKRTNMTLEYSQLCLTGVMWHFDKALAIFEQKKGELPPNAFITGAVIS